MAEQTSLWQVPNLLLDHTGVFNCKDESQQKHKFLQLLSLKNIVLFKKKMQKNYFKKHLYFILVVTVSN